jgi:transcriptional regulator with XRE-family HTH domain
MTEKEFLQKVGFEIRMARIRSGLTGQELADLSGVKIGALFDIEKGRRNGYILNYRRIADTLCVDLSSLLS